MNKTEHRLFLELIADVASLRKEVDELRKKKFHYRLFYNNQWYDKYLDFMLRADDEYVWIGKDNVFGRITRVTYDFSNRWRKHKGDVSIRHVVFL